MKKRKIEVLVRRLSDGKETNISGFFNVLLLTFLLTISGLAIAFGCGLNWFAQCFSEHVRDHLQKPVPFWVVLIEGMIIGLLLPIPSLFSWDRERKKRGAELRAESEEITGGGK